MSEARYPGIEAGNSIKAQDMINALDKVFLPAGIICPYGGASAPTGWSICDGQALLRMQYPDLFAAIGTAWGSGDGSTTFNIPDLRGATMRGVGTSSGFINTQNNQPDNVTVTLAQRDNDATRNIEGYFEAIGQTADNIGVIRNTTATGAMQTALANYMYGGATTGNQRYATQLTFKSSRVVPTANENKVKARGVNFIIKLI